MSVVDADEARRAAENFRDGGAEAWEFATRAIMVEARLGRATATSGAASKDIANVAAEIGRSRGFDVEVLEIEGGFALTVRW